MQRLAHYKSRFNSFSLDQKITVQVLIILALVSLLTGVLNLFVALPVWYALLFIFTGILSIWLLHISFTSPSKYIKVLFLILVYIVAIVSWPFNSGIGGSAILFFLTIIVYTIGIYNKNFFILFFINYFIYSSLVLINFIYPKSILFTYPSETDHIFDMLVSYFLLGISMVFVIRSIINSYKFSKRTIESQKLMLEELNAELTNKTKELKQANDTKNKFFSIIAHDLRNPFAAIIASAEVQQVFLENQNFEKSKQKSEAILRTSQHSYNLLQNLLDWAESQVGGIEYHPEEFDLYELVNSVVLLSENFAFNKNIQLSNLIDKNLTIKADKHMLDVVLRNLVTNAIKFSSPGGIVSIEAKMLDSGIQISVKDDGIGMNEATVDKLFRIDIKHSSPGTQAEKGTGLGLILCKEFIEKHGGKIWVESQAGKGSQFYVEIPRI